MNKLKLICDLPTCFVSFVIKISIRALNPLRAVGLVRSIGFESLIYLEIFTYKLLYIQEFSLSI